MDTKRFFVDTFRSLIPNFGATAFHGDPIYQKLMIELIRNIPISCFVETGTFMGNSSGFIASNFIDSLEIRTCELNAIYLKRAKLRLKRYKNIKFFESSSEEFIANQVTHQTFGGIPLFFLDSHWNTYWPLEDEVKSIAAPGFQSVIVIDDFQVPGRSDFGFDLDITKNGKVCGIDMIRPYLIHHKNLYHFAYPKYHQQKTKHILRGHVALFQNLEKSFEKFISSEFGKANYFQSDISI